jgi:hypothetical protein
MALRDKIITAATPHLQPGETVTATFVASRANPAWSVLSYWIIVAKGYYAVVATDRRTLVFRTSGLSMAKLKGLAKELPRTGFGEPTGKISYKIDLGGESAWVHRRFWGDLRAANAG